MIHTHTYTQRSASYVACHRLLLDDTAIDTASTASEANQQTAAASCQPSPHWLSSRQAHYQRLTYSPITTHVHTRSQHTITGQERVDGREGTCSGSTPPLPTSKTPAMADLQPHLKAALQLPHTPSLPLPSPYRDVHALVQPNAARLAVDEEHFDHVLFAVHPPTLHVRVSDTQRSPPLPKGIIQRPRPVLSQPPPIQVYTVYAEEARH